MSLTLKFKNMKKSLLLLFCLLFVGNFYAQIVSINENWPNLAWNVSGTYTPAALTSNPTVNSNFAYDTALVTPSGANTLLYVTSPFFDVKPAFDGNERVLKIQFNIAFTTYVANALYIEYWNADASNWVGFPDGSAPIQTSGNYQTCSFDISNSPVGVYIDLSSLTTNQLQNFRYRFVINGTSSQIGGVCINNVSVNSRSCAAPTGFTVTGFTNTTATFNWNNTDTGTLRWDFEYGIQGFVLGTGFIQQTNQVPPYTISGLNPNTSYDIYIKKDCSGDNGIIFSNWTGPLTFTTANLGLNAFNADNIKLFPNPTSGLVEINALQNFNEVKIYNVSGQELFHLKENQSHLNVDLSSFSSGLYFAKIYTDFGIGTYKIVKN